MAIETIRTSRKIEILQKSNSDSNTRLSDQWVKKLGTRRKSEMVAKIGNNGQPFEQLINNYLLSL